MTAPDFKPIDEAAFRDGAPVSVAHMKRLARNALYCQNERNRIPSIVYGDLGTNGARRRPRWHSARWVCRGPFLIDIPAPGIGGAERTCTVRIRGDVLTQSVTLAALLAEDVPTSRSGFGDIATTTVTTGTDKAIDLTMRIGERTGVVPFYIAIISAASATVGSVSTYTVNRFISSATAGEGSIEYAIDLTGTGAPSAEYVPEYWVWPTGVTTTGDRSVYRTVAYQQDSTIDTWLLDDDRGLAVIGDLFDTQTFEYGDLGVLSPKSISVDFMQTATLEHAADHAQFRWRRPPSSTHGGTLAREIVAAWGRRFPQTVMGCDQVYTINASSTTGEIGGHWRIQSGPTVSRQNVFTFGIYTGQQSFTTSTQTLRTVVPYFLSCQDAREPSDVTVDGVVTIRDLDDTTTAATSSVITVTVSPDPVAETSSAVTVPRGSGGFEIRRSGGLTARWIKLAEILDSGSGARRYAMDGMTDLGDATRWRFLQIDLDISGLTANTMYLAKISLGFSADSSSYRVAYGDPCMTVLDNG